jgi:hypothetical protein
MFNENGLGDHGTNAARTAESRKHNNDMDEKDDEIAHLSIAARRKNAGNCGANWHKLTIRHRQAGFNLAFMA